MFADIRRFVHETASLLQQVTHSTKLRSTTTYTTRTYTETSIPVDLDQLSSTYTRYSDPYMRPNYSLPTAKVVSS
jgi:hypothetical protein